MHVSLPEELEQRIKDCIESGQYRNASDLVIDALKKFLHASETDSIPLSEADRIREIAAPRLQNLINGSAELIDFDQAFDEIERKHFK